ncbi:hypothetical protein NL108_016843 [Boleophthalmus pectinirostris]|nr:hypothetical protein NL108_016843 [Boleophthalmus pectinirostris]
MSSEVCPFCGKSFKRLKSHLPHCKSAPRREDAKITSENPTKSNAKPENSSQKSPLGKQDVTFSVAPKTNKKTKLKVSEKIKIAAEISSPVSVESSQPSSTSKSKTKINLQTQNDQESISNNPKKLNLRPNAEILPEYFEKQESKSSIAPKSSKKTKPKLTEKLKLSPKTTKSFENSQTATKETKTEDVKDVLTNKTFSNNSKITPNNAEMNLKDNFWPEDQNGVKILPEIDPWNKRETKITLEGRPQRLETSETKRRLKKDSFDR